MSNLKEPMGRTKDNPGRSCYDIWLVHRTFTSGTYWIDPNGGCTADAIEVRCDFENDGETCIKPKIRKVWKKINLALRQKIIKQKGCKKSYFWF